MKRYIVATQYMDADYVFTSDTSRRIYCAKHTDNPEFLEILANDPEEDVRAAVACNPNTPLSVLQQLSGDSSRSVIEDLCSNSNLPQDILKQLYYNNGDYIWDTLSNNPSTPTSVISDMVHKLLANNDQIIHGWFRDILGNLVVNPNTPEDLAAQLLFNTTVQIGVAKLANSTVDMQRVIAEGPSNLAKKYLAENEHTVPEILDILSDVQDSSIRIRVLKNPNITTEIILNIANNSLKTTYGDVQATLLNLYSSNPEVLRILSRCDSPFRRSDVASYRSTPVDVLRNLAEDSSAIVREAVARNYSTPVDVLAWLAQDSWSGVQEGVIYNPNTTKEILETIINNPNTDSHILHIAGWKLR